MSYLFVVVLGTLAGWLGGQYLQKSELGVAVDLAAGAFGGLILVVLTRIVGPAAAGGYLVSIIATIVGAMVGVIVARKVMAGKPAPVVRRRRP